MSLPYKDLAQILPYLTQTTITLTPRDFSTVSPCRVRRSKISEFSRITRVGNPQGGPILRIYPNPLV